MRDVDGGGVFHGGGDDGLGLGGGDVDALLGGGAEAICAVDLGEGCGGEGEEGDGEVHFDVGGCFDVFGFEVGW